MTVSLALQPPVDGTIDSDVTPNRFGGLLGRIKKVGQNLRDAGQNLRNMSRTDALFLGLSIGAGLGAKTAAVSGLAAFGIATGGTGLLAIGAGLAVASVGGASVGVAKSVIKQIRNMKEGKETNFFSRETLKNTASSAVIAAATFGASELFEYTSGQTFGSFLSNAFNKVADVTTDKFMALVSGSDAFQAAKSEALQSQNFASGLVTQAKPIYTPLPEAAPVEAPVAQATVQHAANTNTQTATRPSAQPTAQPTATPKAALNAALIAAQEKAGNEYALNRLREIIQNTTGVAAPDTATAADLAKQFHPSNPEGFLKGLQQQAPQVGAPSVAPTAAPATTPASTPAAAPKIAAKDIAPVAPAAPIAPTPNEIAAQSVLKVQSILTQEELTNHYALEHMRQLVKDATGIDAPDTATAAELAQQYHPQNADAFLKTIQQQAPQLKVENVAAACTTEIPKEKSAVNVIKTLCYKFKEHMTGSDIVTVDNVNEAEPQKGLRLLYRKAAGLVRGATPTESTNSFIGENVSGPNGVVQEMTEAALAL